jgi:hypothetical protein
MVTSFIFALMCIFTGFNRQKINLSNFINVIERVFLQLPNPIFMNDPQNLPNLDESQFSVPDFTACQPTDRYSERVESAEALMKRVNQK